MFLISSSLWPNTYCQGYEVCNSKLHHEKKGASCFISFYFLWMQLVPYFLTELNGIFIECFLSSELLHILKVLQFVATSWKKGLHVLFYFLWRQLLLHFLVDLNGIFTLSCDLTQHLPHFLADLDGIFTWSCDLRHIVKVLGFVAASWNKGASCYDFIFHQNLFNYWTYLNRFGIWTRFSQIIAT